MTHRSRPVCKPPAIPSEYVRELIRADQRQLAKQRLEAEVIRGLASGESRPLTKGDWDRLKANVGKREG